MTKNKRGFTLVEVALATVLLAAISLTIYAAFSNGVRLWNRVMTSSPEEDVNLFFIALSRDIRSMARIVPLDLKGEEELLSFPSTVLVEKEDGSMVRTVGTVSYYQDDDSIVRKTLGYSEIYRSKEGRVSRRPDNVESLRFEYYCYDERDKEYVWVREWTKSELPDGEKMIGRLPLAVKVVVTRKEGDEDKEFTKIVAVPAGG